jgi:hypothetical protein
MVPMSGHFVAELRQNDLHHDGTSRTKTFTLIILNNSTLVIHFERGNTSFQYIDKNTIKSLITRENKYICLSG